MEVFDVSNLKSDAIAEANADIREIKTDDFKSQVKRLIWKISDNNEKILSIRKSADKSLDFAVPQAIAV